MLKYIHHSIKPGLYHQ